MCKFLIGPYWVPVFIPWRPLWKTSGRWGKGAGEVESRTFSELHGMMWHFTVLFQSQMVFIHPRMGCKSFPSTLLIIPQPHRGILSLVAVESLWPAATWSDGPLGYSECWISGLVCGRLSGMDQAKKKKVSPRCIIREDIRCDVDENQMQITGLTSTVVFLYL